MRRGEEEDEEGEEEDEEGEDEDEEDEDEDEEGEDEDEEGRRRTPANPHNQGGGLHSPRATHPQCKGLLRNSHVHEICTKEGILKRIRYQVSGIHNT